jgi:hypothetical protein
MSGRAESLDSSQARVWPTPDPAEPTRRVGAKRTVGLHSTAMLSTTPIVMGLRLSGVVNCCAVVAAARAL